MSIADELNHLSGDIGDAYDAVNDMGGVIPAAKNMDNLDTAIRTIPQPTVNDGTLTIQKNGTSVATFTANQASNATANITVPTNTSDLNNDSGFITSASLPTKTSDLTNDGSDGTSTYVEADDLATVATTGAYSDLSGTPTIPTATSDLTNDSGFITNADLPTKTSDLTNDGSDGTSTYVEADDLATVATSGSYTDLTNTPTIPTATSDLTNDSGFITSSSLPGDMTGATSQDAGAHGLVPAPAAGDENKVLSGAGTWVAVSSGGSYSAGNGINIDANNEISIDSTVVAEVSDIPTQTSDLTNDGADGTSTYVEADELATVATSGSYTDLTNTPSIPAAQVNSDWNAVSGVAEILNKPSLATVATTGAYSDLSGTPTIPTVNNATLTVTQNGTSAGTFTANASSDVTIALTDTTYSAMTGASSGTAGTSGLVPAPAAGDEAKVLSGAGTWVNQSGGSTYTAGNGISISANDEISIDTSVVAELSDLPTVNDGTLTIQHNGTSKGTFTANQSTASTVNIETIYADDYISTSPIPATVTTAMIEDGAITVAKLAANVMSAIYPVGSIYMSATMSTAAQVESAFGGTWVAWGSGRVPVGVDTSQTEFDTVEETGGEKAHTLTVQEMPSHNHAAKGWASVSDGSGSYIVLGGAGYSTDYSTNNRGDGQAHNNLQPYITCYMYKRTA